MSKGEALVIDFSDGAGGGDAKKGPPRKFVPRPAPAKKPKPADGDAAAAPAAKKPLRSTARPKPTPGATAAPDSGLPDPPSAGDDGPIPPKAAYSFDESMADPFGAKKKPKMMLDDSAPVAAAAAAAPTAAAADATTPDTATTTTTTTAAAATPAPTEPAAASADDKPAAAAKPAAKKAAEPRKPSARLAAKTTRVAADAPPAAAAADAAASDDGPIPPKAVYAFDESMADPFGAKKKPKMVLDDAPVAAAAASAAPADSTADSAKPPAAAAATTEATDSAPAAAAAPEPKKLPVRAVAKKPAARPKTAAPASTAAAAAPADAAAASDDGPVPPKAAYAFDESMSDPFGAKKKPKMVLDDAPVAAASASAASDSAPAAAAATESASADAKPAEPTAAAAAPVRPPAKKVARPTTAPAPAAADPPADGDEPIPPKAAYAFDESMSDPFGAKKKPKMAFGDDAPIGGPATSSSADDASSSAPVASAAPPRPAVKKAAPAKKPEAKKPPAAAAAAASPKKAAPAASSSSGGDTAAAADLEPLLASKNWKERLEGLEKMKSYFDLAEDGKSDVFARYGGAFKKAIADSNPSCQEKCVDAALVFIDRANCAMTFAEATLGALVSKGLSAAKTSVHDKSLAAVLLYIEIGASDAALAALGEALSDKLPKVVEPAVECLIAALKEYGPRNVPIDRVQKLLKSPLENTNGKVRERAIELCCEIYRWMGAIFQQSLAALKLKPAQLKDLETKFKDIKFGEARPNKRTRAEEKKAAKAGPAAAGGKSGGGAGGGKQMEAKEEAFDPMSLVKPVDLLTVLPKDWMTKMQAAKVWKEKQAQLDELVKAAETTPKIATSGSLGDIVAACKACLKDKNVMVVGKAIRVCTLINNGTRKEFSQYAKALLKEYSPLFKSDKSQVDSVLDAALDAFFAHKCVDLSADCMDVFTENVKNKVSVARVRALGWFNRYLRNPASVSTAAVKGVAKPLWELLVAALYDSAPDVRAIATMCTGALVAIVGKRDLHSQITKLETKDKKKADEVADLATSACGASAGSASALSTAGVGTAAAPAAAAASKSKDDDGDAGGADPNDDDDGGAPKKTAPKKTAPKKVGAGKAKSGSSAASDSKGEDSKPSPSKSGPPKSLGAKKPAAAASGAAKSGDTKSKGPAKEDTFEPAAEWEYDTAASKLDGVLKKEVFDGLKSKNFKERDAAMDGVAAAVRDMKDPAPHTEAVMYLLHHTPKFNDTNFSVCKKSFSVAAELAKNSSAFNKSLVVLPLAHVLAKMNDKKVSGEGNEFLNACCERLGPKFVLAQIHKLCKSIKAPAALADTVSYVARAVDEFGLAVMDPQLLVDYGREWLESTNKPIKDAGTKLYVSIYKQTGDVLKEKMLGGLKPALATAISAEFGKVPAEEVGLGKHVPTRTLKPGAAGAPAAGASAAGGAAKQLSLDDLVPRQDISKKITEKTMKKLEDKNWKVRKEGLDEIAGLLAECNHRIGPKDGDIFSGLKGRLADANKNLVKQALELCTQFALDMGAPVKTYAKKVLDGVLVGVADSKSLVKESAIKTLDTYCDVCTLPIVLPHLPAALGSAGTAGTAVGGRKEILEIVSRHFAKVELKVAKKFELHEMVPVVLCCLEDKSAEVRAQAEKMLVHLIKTVGFNAVKSETKSLKKATLLVLTPLLDKYRDGVTGDDDDAPATAAAPAKGGKTDAKKSTAGGKTSKTAGGKEAKEPAAAAKSDAKSGGKVSSKTAPVAAAASAAASKDEDGGGDEKSAGSVYLKKCDAKTRTKRLDIETKRMKGSFREWQTDEIEEMKSDLSAYLNEEVMKKLFNPKNDFKAYVAGIDMLESEIGTGYGYSALCSTLDLVFKYLTSRMADNANTAVLTKILEFLSALFAKLKEKEWKMHDSEASLLLPFLVEKTIGHSQVKFRTSTRALFGSMCHCFAPSKVFNYLMDGVEKAKNLKARAECLEECTLMIAKIGLSVCPYKKLIPAVAKHVGAADASIREKALAFLAGIYSIVGEEVWTHLGGKDKCKLGIKEKGLVEQRFKNTTISDKKAPDTATAAAPAMNTTAPVAGKAAAGKGASPAKPAAKPAADALRPTTAPPAAAADDANDAADDSAAARPALQVNRMVAVSTDTMNIFSLDLDAIGMSANGAQSAIPPAAVRPTTAPVAAAPVSRLRAPAAIDSGIPSLTGSAIPAVSSLAAFSGGSAFSDRMQRVIFHALESSLEEERIDAMKEIWTGVAEKGAQIVQPHTDKVVSSLLAQIAWSFNESDTAAGVASTADVFTGPLTVRHRLAKYALNTLMEIFKKPGLAAEVHLSTLDKLILELLGRLVDPRLKRLDDGNSLIKALDVLMLKVLENGDRTSSFIVLLNALRTRVSRACVPGSVRTKALVELVMKCAVKVTKAISLTIDQLNLSAILNSMHSYLVASADFAPAPLIDEALKIVRTILSEFVRLKGLGLRAYMLDIPADSRLSTYFLQMQEYNSKMDKALAANAANGSAATATAAAPAPAIKVPVVGRPASNSSTGSGSNSASNTPRGGGESKHYRPSDLIATASAAAASSAPVSDGDKENTSASSGAAGSGPFAAELESIFRRLLKTETTAAALKELYAFMCAHPSVDVQPYILRTSTPFQGYIERGLKSVKLAAENNLQTPAKKPAAAAAAAAAAPAEPHVSPANYRARLKELQARAGMLGSSASIAAAPAPVQPTKPVAAAPALAPAPAPTATATAPASKIPASRIPVRASLGGGAIAPAATAVPAPVPASGAAKPISDIKARLASIRASSALSPPRV